jgi:hypothetical protein
MTNVKKSLEQSEKVRHRVEESKEATMSELARLKEKYKSVAN